VFRTTQNGSPVLYFGPSERLSMPADAYELQWGKSLLEFTPTLKTSGQARAVTVRTANRGGSRRLETLARIGDFQLNHDLQPYLQEMGEDKDVPDRALRTQDEVREFARATVRAALKELVEVSGSTIGLPDLRAGQVIRITGVDYRFDGRYFVTQTTHTIDTNGYKTSFRARREETGSAS
jgi:phage protein D